MRIVDFLDKFPAGMLLIASDGTILDMNRFQEENSGLNRESAIGKKVMDVYPRFFKIKKATDLYYSSIREKKPVTIRLPRYRAQYKDVITELVVNMIPLADDRFLIIIFNNKDLYDVRKALRNKEARLRKSEYFLNSVINSSPNIVLVLDNKFRITTANKTALRELGYKNSELIGRYIGDIVYPFKEVMEPICAKGYIDCFLDGIRSDGSEFPIEATINPVEGFRGKYFLFIAKNIEERRKLEERIAEMENLALIGEIMGSIVHRILNPMVGLVNTMELLIEGSDNERDLRLMKSAYNSALRILETLRSIMYHSKERLCKKEWISMGELKESFEALVQEMASQNAQRKIQININGVDNYESICVDKYRILEAVENIIKNAIDATPISGRIRMNIGAKNGVLVIEVEDNGKGMTGSEIKNAIKPFYSSRGSMGMGLYLSNRIVKEHNGEIEIESEVGKGTKVRILIPIR